ncbi:MAG: MvdC/MvdD family ATP grasp protein [Bacteroidota bacterium]
MILIISHAFDTITDLVMVWLKHLGAQCLRLDHPAANSVLSMQIGQQGNEISLQVGDQSLPMDRVKKVWHRRAKLHLLPKALQGSYSNREVILNQLKKEEDLVSETLEKWLRSKVDYMGSYIREKRNNLLDDLLLAQQVGLDIPATLVTGDQKQLLQFHNRYPKMISKSLLVPHLRDTKGRFYTKGTHLVDRQAIEALAPTFAPLLVQEYKEKSYELRVFIFKTRCHAMAIFSQNNEHSQIDCRKDNPKKPSRTVPFQLPQKIEQQLLELMKLGDYDTGSIDLIVGPDGTFTFLEINPMGQFLALSRSCNYYLDQQIAQYLSHAN